MAASNVKRPELLISGNTSENLKNFELRFDDPEQNQDSRTKIQDPEQERDEYYKKPPLEIAALRSSMPDEALQVIRYMIDPQIRIADKKKPWIWMSKLREHFTGSMGSSQMTDRFKFWHSSQCLNLFKIGKSR